MAKEGSNSKSLAPEPVCGIAKATVKQTVASWLMEQHKLHWTKIPAQSHSKAFIEEPLRKRSIEALMLSRNNLRTVTGILTGHCHLNKHLHRLGISNNALCSKCKKVEETAAHILCKCEAVALSRYKYFGLASMSPKDFTDISLSKILDYVNSLGILKN